MNKRFWKKVIWIGLPVAIQNLINTLLNMCDTLMIESLGEDYVSAVGLANKVFFVMNLLVFGVVSGCSVLQSQNYGKKDNVALNKVFGFSIMLAFAAGFLFCLASLLIPNVLMSLFTKSEVLIEIGGSYLRIVAVSYLFTAVSMGITGLLKSVNKTRAPMLITLGCVLINVLINYIFIFGSFGAPRLETDGAAIGTVIARGIELLVLILYLLFTKKDFILSIKNMFIFNKPFVKKVLIIAVPVVINEFLWGLGTTIYSVIYGHMSNDVVNIMTIATLIQDLVYAFLFGISNACAVIVGNELGANNLDKARITAKKLLTANFIFSFILAGVLVLLVNPYLLIYRNTSDLIKQNVRYVCIVFACYMPVKSFNLTNVCGVLRSGGDTKFCLFLDGFGVWGVAIPLGCLAAFAFKFNIIIVFAFICFEEVFKFVLGFIRYKKEKWLKNVTFSYNEE